MGASGPMLVPCQFLLILTQHNVVAVEFRVVWVPVKAVQCSRLALVRLHLKRVHSCALSLELTVNSLKDSGPLLGRHGSLVDSFAGAGMTLTKGVSPRTGHSKSLCLNSVSKRISFIGQTWCILCEHAYGMVCSHSCIL